LQIFYIFFAKHLHNSKIIPSIASLNRDKMKNNTSNTAYQLQVLEIELTGIIALTRKPNLLYRELYENRIALLIARKNQLLEILPA